MEDLETLIKRVVGEAVSPLLHAQMEPIESELDSVRRGVERIRVVPVHPITLETPVKVYVRACADKKVHKL